jgi:hypothetical protein
MWVFTRQIVATLALAVIAVAYARGQDGQPEPFSSANATGVRHALLVCGLAGDAAHRTLFAGTVETLFTGLKAHHGFATEKVTVLWSDAKAKDAGPAVLGSRGAATRETLAEAAAALAKAVQPEDALWVFVLGHAHYDGKNCWLNLPGPDMNQTEFANLFAGLQCTEQVFFMTTAASGFFVRPLFKPGRVVIGATEADREVNETIFPHKLAAVLAQAQPLPESDMDGDGRMSLLDVYLKATRETAQEYANEMLLATEHAQLDDNGDGRGTELQADFLPEELGGRPTAGRKAPPSMTSDGAVARRLILGNVQ